MKKRILIVVLSLFVLLQFIQPDRIANSTGEKTDILSIENTPIKVKNIIKNVCYDCHSNQVNYPWYSYISPLSWWLQDHINEGREHLNFSIWNEYNAEKKAHKMEEAREEVEAEKMPLPSYTLIHGDAKINAKEKQLLLEWFIGLEKKYN